MVGTKGGSSSGHFSTAHMSEPFYADERGDWFMWRNNTRKYLAAWQIEDRLRWEQRFGRRLRVRVRARSVA